MPVNPYQWLGIDPRITNPNYFQLLGVASNPIDEADFVQQIKAAVVAKKRLLKQVDITKYKEVIDKLEVRIDKAAAVLGDPRLRIKYLSRLKSETSQEANLAGKTANPEPPAAPPKFEDIPMAIPIRRASSTGDQSANQPSFRDGEEQGEGGLSFKRFSSSKPTELYVDESLFIRSGRSRAFRRHQNGTLLLRIATGAFFLIAIAGLILVTVFLLDSPKSEQTADNQGNPKTNVSPPQTPVVSTPEMNETKINDNSNPDGRDDKIEGVKNDTPPEPEFADNHFADDPKENPSATDDRLPQHEEKTTIQEAESTPENGPADLLLEEHLKRWKEIKQELSQHEFTRMVKHFRLIRSSIDRRDYVQAKRRLATLNESIEQFDADRTKAIDLLRKWRGAYEQFLDYVEGFQKQYAESVSKISPAQTFVMHGTEYAFVEIRDKNITLRSGGVNLTFDWKFLPLDLAIEIAKQGEIPDVPTYRLFEAAFRVAQPNGLTGSMNEVESLISQSVRDGHKDSDFKWYLFDDELLEIDTRQHDLMFNERYANAIEEIRKELNYTDLNSSLPGRASEIYEGLARLETDDPVKQTAALREGVDVAIRSLDAELVVEAVKELSLVAGTDYQGLLLESLTKVASRKLDVGQTMALKRAFESLGTEDWMLIRVHKQLVDNLKSRIEQHADFHQLQGFAKVSAAKK